MTTSVGRRNQRWTVLGGSSRPYPETAEETGGSRSVAADRARRQLIPRYVFTRTQVSALPLRNFLLHNFWLRNFQYVIFCTRDVPPRTAASSSRRHCDVIFLLLPYDVILSSNHLLWRHPPLSPPLWRHPSPPRAKSTPVPLTHPPRRVPELESPLLIRLFMNFILNNSLWNIRV